MLLNKRILSVFTIMLLGLLLIACGGDDSTTTTEETTTETTTSETTTTEETTTEETTTETTTTETTTTEETTTEVTTPLYETVTDVYIHLNRTMAMVEDLQVTAFGKDLDDEWPIENEVVFNFTNEDNYGIYAIIPFDELSVARSSLGFVIETADDTAVHTQVEDVDFSNQDESGIIHIYVDEVNDNFDYELIVDAPLISFTSHYISHFQPQAPLTITRELFDDFTRSVIDQTGVTYSGDVELSDRVKHLVVNYTDTLGITPDDAIYKAATGSNTQGSFAYLALVMKGSNGASINDLQLAFRYDDNHELITLDFSDLVDPDYQALPELSTDYQVYLIDIANSLDGLTFVGKTGYTDVAATSSIVGFHLIADDIGSGTLEMEEIYYTNDPVSIEYSDTFDFLIDNFQKDSVSETLTDVYWCGSIGYIVDKWLIMDSTDAEVIYEDNNHPINALENVEITLRSDVADGDIYVTPIYNDGTTDSYGTESLLSALLDDEGNPLGTLTTTFTTKRINLANNTWDTSLVGLKLRLSTGEGVVTIDKIEYITITEGADPVYPEINTNDVIVFDDFEREDVGATTAYTTDNPVAEANDLYYIITYSDAVNKGQLYMENGALVFDNTVDTSYINFVEAAKNGNLETHKYMAFRLKTDQGGSLEHFRLQTGTDDVTWANDFYAAPGMKSIDSPYFTNDGFMYIVVDLELSGLLTFFEELTLYYSDEGRLIIDNIFFANDAIKELDLETKTVADDLDGTSIYTAGGDYQYNHIGLTDFNSLNQRYMVITLKGTGFENFRFQTYAAEASDTLYITDLVGIDGYKYSLDDLSDNEYRYLIIDLQASNLDFHPEGIHLHLNNAKIYIHSIFFADTIRDFELSETPESEIVFDPTFDIDGTTSGYVYNYIGLDNAVYSDYLILNVSGNVASLRFQFINQDESVTSGFYFLSDLIGINGAPLFFEANTTETQTLIIDLKASGIEQNIGAMHVHYGDDDPTADDMMSFHSIELVNRTDKEPEIETEALGTFAPTEGLVIDATTAGYVYTYAGMDNPVLADIMEIVVSGNAESIRFQFINNDESVTSATYFLSDLIGIDGNPLLFQKNTEGEQTLLIDLIASGINQNIQAFHIHYGDGDPTADDIITIHSISFYDIANQKVDEITVNEVYSPVDPFTIDATADAYMYNYLGLDNALTTERYLEITVQGNISSLRLQAISVGETFTSATYFLSDLIGVNGNSLEFIPNTTEPQTIIIDLYASGLGFDITAFHLHYGDDDPTADDVMSIININAYMQINSLEDLDTAIGE